MTNDKTVTMSRELAELRKLAEQACGTSKDSPEYKRFLAAMNPTLLLDLTAAPVVESQEPVAWICHGPKGSGLVALQWSHLPPPVGLERKIPLRAEQPAPIECGAPKNEFDARFLRSIDSGNGQPSAFSHNSQPSEFNHENYGACSACGETPRVYGGYQTHVIPVEGGSDE